MRPPLHRPLSRKGRGGKKGSAGTGPRLNDERSRTTIRPDGRFALLPVAGAEFVGLQGVEHTEDFFRVAADAQGVGADPLNRAVRVDDVGHAEAYVFVDVQMPRSRERRCAAKSGYLRFFRSP